MPAELSTPLGTKVTLMAPLGYSKSLDELRMKGVALETLLSD